MQLQIQTQHNEHHRQQDAFSRFMYGIKSDETRRYYVSKLEFFFDFCKIEGKDIREKSENFLEYTRKGKNITQKVTDLVLNYMYFHIQRAQKKEISRGTIRNFYKPIKLFCEMNNVVLNWKIISKGLPRGTQNANDRIPTIDEILEVLKFPDRRITFLGKRIILKENPRKGICSLCGREGYTHMHHIQYHEDDPLKDTIELCVGCHKKQHALLRLEAIK